MFNYIVCDILQYLEPFNFIDMLLFKVQLFDHLTVCKQMTDV